MSDWVRGASKAFTEHWQSYRNFSNLAMSMPFPPRRCWSSGKLPAMARPIPPNLVGTQLRRLLPVASPRSRGKCARLIPPYPFHPAAFRLAEVSA